MTWYRTGTVSVENASTTVTGSLTAWLMAAKTGDAFVGPDDARYEITAVNSNTEIEIYPAYAGSTASGQSYAVERISTAWNSVSELSVTIAETAEAFQRGFAMRSTSSVEIGAGEHEFSGPPGLPILPGATLKIASALPGEADTHWIGGVVTEYEGQSLHVLAQSWRARRQRARAGTSTSPALLDSRDRPSAGPARHPGRDRSAGPHRAYGTDRSAGPARHPGRDRSAGPHRAYEDRPGPLAPNGSTGREAGLRDPTTRATASSTTAARTGPTRRPRRSRRTRIGIWSRRRGRTAMSSVPRPRPPTASPSSTGRRGSSSRMVVSTINELVQSIPDPVAMAIVFGA